MNNHAMRSTFRFLQRVAVIFLICLGIHVLHDAVRGDQVLTAGHEQLARREGMEQGQSQVRYLRYEEQEMDPRIRDAEIRGKALIATIDGIPVSVTLPEKVIDAYSKGALPLGTLANAVLQRCDQMQQLSEARDRFEEESRTEGRTLSQR